MQLSLLAGVGAAGAVILLVLLVRFLVALVRTDSAVMAWDRTTKWTMAIAMAVGSAAATGLVQFGDLVGGAVGFIASHPFVVSNLGITGLGAGALSGAFALSPQQFVGLAIALVGIVFMVVEVDDVT